MHKGPIEHHKEFFILKVFFNVQYFLLICNIIKLSN